MKKNIFISILLLCLTVVSAQGTYEQRQKRTEWFQEARFGMFIHWGIYSIPARGEWVRNQEKLTIKDYQPYFDNFNPVDYNPVEWASLAKAAGMKYVVLTAKHHDGFCLFDSKYTEYKATNTPANRDLIKEYVEAFRAEGIRVGFYYSLIDWHHKDYPNVGNHPMHGNAEFDKKEYNWNNYLKYMHNQVEELVTNYGKIDIMWFDYSFDEYKGEKWKATELVQMVRKHQPHIIIDNRLGGNMEKENPEAYAGDFEGPEQIIPAEIMCDELGRTIPWETCITLNNEWGYARNSSYKTTKDVIRSMVNCVSKGGNLLLNVGPDSYGRIPDRSQQILCEVGEWLDINGESIYGCGPAQLSKPEWGFYTQKGNTLYAHIMEKSIGQYYLKQLNEKTVSGNLLCDGAEVFLTGYWNGDHKPFVKKDDLFMAIGKPIQVTHELPDAANTVVKIILKEEK